MKITIAYLPEIDQEAAESARAAIEQLFPGAKIKDKEDHPPYRHIYFKSYTKGIQKTAEYNSWYCINRANMI